MSPAIAFLLGLLAFPALAVSAAIGVYTFMATVVLLASKERSRD